MAQDSSDLVELPVTDGVAFVEQGSPLTRLHYFDGKFLRADAFATEQDYHRVRVQLSNVAGGWGVVHGLGVGLEGTQLVVGGGMAVTAAGNFVLATTEMRADLTTLLGAAQAVQAGGANAAFANCAQGKKGVMATTGLTVHEITAAPIAGLCGNESVYGKLCQTACVGESQRPFWREGVVLRLRPVVLELPASTTVSMNELHLRNRVASAYFAAEPWLTPPQLSAAGLAGSVWCGTASLNTRDEVVIGLLVMDGSSGRVDAWSGRRERMDTQARGYWQGVMAMRPWNVFVAQILQFQCQLSGVLDSAGSALLPPDNCDAVRAALRQTRAELARLTRQWADSAARLAEAGKAGQVQMLSGGMKASFDQIGKLDTELAVLEKGGGTLPSRRMLIAAGFLDLPPAGYLPVVPNKVALQDQLQRMFGEGVRLQLHAVRAAEIGHLVEQAQHLERISLTRGIDDPKAIEDVEVFVPDGIETTAKALSHGEWWEFRFGIGELALPNQLAAMMKVQAAPSAPAAAASPATAPAAAAAAAPKSRGKAKAQPAAREGLADTTVQTLVPETLSRLQFAGLGGADAAAAATATLVDDDPPGLARTYVTDGGSFALALLSTTPGSGQDVNTTGAPVAPKTAVWLAGEVAGDPFDLDPGGTVGATVEFALGSKTLGLMVSSDITVELKSHKLLASGDTVLAVALSASTRIDLVFQQSLSLSVVIPGSENFTLARRGNADTGHLLFDGDDFDTTNGAGEVRWDVDPREAVLELIIERVIKAAGLGFAKLQSAGFDQAALRALASLQADVTGKSDVAGFQQALGTAGQPGQITATLRLRLARARGLPGMPAPDSAAGVLALAGLQFIAERTAEPGFEPRARRKLFPTLDDKPPQRTVRPVLDWVMFRRARTSLCAAPCSTVAETALDAIQVWHLRVNGAGELRAVEAALTKRDAAVLGKLAFRRVGVLHYRDAGTTPEEAGVHVRALWTAAQPGKQVVLGRAWEVEPATGQGWQNHARLRAMLKAIDPITAAPPAGDGSITVLAPPPAPLADGTLDGGMLVVTADDEAVTVTHRVGLTLDDAYATVVSAFDKTQADGWKAVQNLRKAQKLLVFDVDFVNGALTADSKKGIAEARAKLGDPTTQTVIRALRIDRSGSTPPNAAQQHTAILAEMSGVPTGGDDGKRTAPVADLGGGATVMTLAWLQNLG